MHIHWFGTFRQSFAKRWSHDEDHIYYNIYAKRWLKHDSAYVRVWQCRCGKEKRKVNLIPDLYAWGG